MNLFAWVQAWEAAMAEAGYPKARLEPFYDEIGWTYTWLTDLDAFTDPTYEQPHEAWQAAHLAFVIVDSLRPDEVRPSPKLHELLTIAQSKEN